MKKVIRINEDLYEQVKKHVNKLEDKLGFHISITSFIEGSIKKNINHTNEVKRK